MIYINIEKKLHGSNSDFNLAINIQMKSGDFVTIYGPSGAGKTTLLRILAGLTQPDKGFIEVQGERWFDSEKSVNLPPQKRKIGYLFQDYALFPNMTVQQNLEYALDKDYRLSDNRTLIENYLDIMNIEKLQHRKPETLSGGQKQRVALARALVRQPDILLLDEPLSALDQEMRVKLQDTLLKIHHKLDVTILMISHELTEVLKLSQYVYIIDNGVILREGEPIELFTEHKISGQLKLYGEILKIAKCDIVYIFSVLIGNSIIEAMATPEEAKNYKVGDKVVLYAKTLNPIICKIS